MAKVHKISGIEPLCSYLENARIILPQKVEEVYSWEPFIYDVARHKELHNMRISLKRLRYTMELFQSVYQSTMGTCDRFIQFLSVIIDVQKKLGTIHDCDVRLKIITDYGAQLGQGAAPPGIATLIVRTKETRKAEYETFLDKWEYLATIRLKQKLLAFLTT